MSHRDKLVCRIEHRGDAGTIDIEIWFYEEENAFGCDLNTFGYSLGPLEQVAECIYATGGFLTPERAEAAARALVDEHLTAYALAADEPPPDPERWQSLPLLPIAMIAKETEPGSFYVVHAVSVVSYPEEILPDDVALCDTELPWLGSIAVGPVGSAVRWYRVAPAFTDSVATLFSAAAHTKGLLPCVVEFGVLRGIHYAEF